MSTFRSVVKPKKIKVTTDFSGVLDFTGKATAFEFSSGQSLPFSSVIKTEHLIDGQVVELYNESTSDILIAASLTVDNQIIDIEPGTAAVLIWTSVGLFKDIGGTAAVSDVQENLEAHQSTYQAHSHDGANSVKIKATDLDTIGGANQSYLKIVNGLPVWFDPFTGIQSDMISMSSTDTSTDINTSTWTNIPLGGVVDIPPTSPYLTKIGDTVQVNFSGKVEITFNVLATSNVQRATPHFGIAINGEVDPSLTATAYIRNTSGINKASGGLSKTLKVNSGDIISVMGIQGGASGITNLVPGGAFLEVKIPTSQMSKGAKGDAGYSGWDFLYGSTVPAVGLGNNGDIYLRTSTGDLYKKESSVWTVISNLKGPQGQPGTKLAVIQANESSNLSNNTEEWAFGDGGSGENGVALYKAGRIVGATLFVRSAPTSSATVEILLNGISTGHSVTLEVGERSVSFEFGSPTVFAAGDVLGFRTVLGGGASYGTIQALVEYF